MTFQLELMRQKDVKNFINYNKTVPEGLTSATITVNNNDTNYMVLATPSWETTVWITNKTNTNFKGNFGTAAPAGAKIDYIVIYA